MFVLYLMSLHFYYLQLFIILFSVARYNLFVHRQTQTNQQTFHLSQLFTLWTYGPM